MSYKPLYDRVHQQLSSNTKGWLVGGERMAQRKKSTTKTADKIDALTGKTLSDDLVYDANKDLDDYDKKKKENKTREDVQEAEDRMTEKKLSKNLESERGDKGDYLWVVKIFNPDDSKLKEGYELKDFHLQSASPTYESRLIQHPTEDGTVRIDNKVVNPRRFEIRGWVPETHLWDLGNSTSEEKIAEKYKNWFIGLVESKNKKAKMTVRMGDVWGWEDKSFNVIRFNSRASTERIGIFDFTIIAQELMLTASKETRVSKGDLADSKSLGGQG